MERFFVIDKYVNELGVIFLLSFWKFLYSFLRFGISWVGWGG